MELLDAYSRAVAAVVDSVGPAVVSISGRKNQSYPATDQMYKFAKELQKHVVN